MLQELCRQYGISYLGLFGSYARGEATPESDVDFLVKFKKESRPKGLFGYADVGNKFADLLGKEIDLVETRLVREEFKPFIYSSLKTIYATPNN